VSESDQNNRSASKYQQLHLHDDNILSNDVPSQQLLNKQFTKKVDRIFKLNK